MAEASVDQEFREALDLLDELARNNKAQLQFMISDGYGDLKSAFRGRAENVPNRERDGGEQTATASFASMVREKMRRNPWPYLRRTAAGFLIVGLLLARRRK
jgi:hypothetical protein